VTVIRGTVKPCVPFQMTMTAAWALPVSTGPIDSEAAIFSRKTQNLARPINNMPPLHSALSSRHSNLRYNFEGRKRPAL
jgi:hypothetical protein